MRMLFIVTLKKHHYQMKKNIYQILAYLKDLNAEEIIRVVEPKIEKGLEIKAKELALYALIPMIVDEDIEKYIKRVVHNLLQVKATDSIKNLSYRIAWLIVDKFVENKEDRQILCDRLGDRMSLIYEYGERKEEDGIKKGMKEILLSFINSGETLPELSQKTGKSIKELEKILNS